MEDTKIVEVELVTNERIVEHSALGRIKLRRPTPAVDAKVAEHRRKVYHSDLKNPDILTKKEVEKLLSARGVWEQHDTDRMRELTIMSGDLMARLTAVGYDSSTNVYSLLVEQQLSLQALYGEVDVSEVREALRRLFNMDSPVTTADIKILRKHSPSTAADELVDQVQTTRFMAETLQEFSETKAELNTLMESYAKFFGDTIESRAERTERLAHVYYCAVNAETHEPLWDTFDAMWDAPPDHVGWLHAQLFYFQNGLTDEYVDTLAQYGFMERVVDTGNLSESSPDHPMSNSDGESAESEPPTSSESETPTT